MCESDGSWFRHPETNKTWSNYTTCVNLDDFEVTNRSPSKCTFTVIWTCFFQWRRQINLIYETGYTVSLVAILLSLGILGYFK